jgi:hypothetical protein
VAGRSLYAYCASVGEREGSCGGLGRFAIAFECSSPRCSIRVLGGADGFGIRIALRDCRGGAMKTAAIIWLACFAVYVELLARARQRNSVGATLPWPIILLGAGAIASVFWAAWIGKIAASTIQAAVAQLW